MGKNVSWFAKLLENNYETLSLLFKITIQRGVSLFSRNDAKKPARRNIRQVGYILGSREGKNGEALFDPRTNKI